MEDYMIGRRCLSIAAVLLVLLNMVPVLADGSIYCRSAEGDLVCVDVRDPQSNGESP